MQILKFSLLAALTLTLFSSCQENEDVKKEPIISEQDVSYSANNVNMNGFVAFDSANADKRPVVLVVHEWWGLNDYAKMRTRELAKLGYLAMAVDMYGDRKQGETPDSASKLAMPFYVDPVMAKSRFDAALAKIKTYSQADTSKIAAIGYCFGGAQVLNFARLGSPLKGVVSFHGNLVGTPANKELLQAGILVCHGAVDPFVPQQEVDQFKNQMDSIGASYTFKAYDSAVHAFTNPNSTEVGRKFNIPIAYNAAADTASWKDMKDFLNRVFK